MTVVILISSPRRSSRTYSCSSFVATTPTKPASARIASSLAMGVSGVAPAAAASGPVADHEPGRQHRRRGDDALTAGVTGGLLVDVDGVLVAHRLDEVADHRLVDGVLSVAGRRGLEAAGPTQAGEEGLLVGGVGLRRASDSQPSSGRSCGPSLPRHAEAGDRDHVAQHLVGPAAEGVDVGAAGVGLELSAEDGVRAPGRRVAGGPTTETRLRQTRSWVSVP